MARKRGKRRGQHHGGVYGVNTEALKRALVIPDPAVIQKDQYLFIRHSEKRSAIKTLLGLAWQRPEYDPKQEAKTLAVVHMDTALNMMEPVFFHAGVQSAALDDRLGAYTILWELGHLPYDVLLTTGEEVGRSTAQFFRPAEHNYNWIFSFDRRGTGAVLYQYETDKTVRLLEKADVVVEMGSFSDISYLGHLGVSGINFGVGYNGEHSHKCSARYADIRTCIDNFKRFWNLFQNKRLTHTEEKWSRYGRSSYSSYANGWEMDENQNYYYSGYNSRGSGSYGYVYDSERDMLVPSGGKRHSFKIYRDTLDPREHPSVLDVRMDRCELCDEFTTVYDTYEATLCRQCFVWIN